MNEEKFSGKAEIYDKYRPSYPGSLMRWLMQHTEVRDAADIGAGTGKFTACLATLPWDITAVEPNADMLARLRANLPNIRAVQASAEDTGLPANSFDLITVAQAFHWFDKQRFKAECLRLLRDNGRLAVVWNERSKTGLSAERDAVCMKYCGAFHSGHVFTGDSRFSVDGDSFLRKEFFSDLDYFAEDYHVLMTREEFIGDTLSRSYALSEEDAQYADFIAELNEVFSRFQVSGMVTAEYKTTCYLGKF